MLLFDFIIFVLSLWVGFEVISKVPATLHTPLMSAANSIHGIVLAGGIVIAATAHNVVGYILAFVAVAFAAMNVVGGYVVTGRMLKMFKRRPATPAAAVSGAGPAADAIAPSPNGAVSANGSVASGSVASGSAPAGKVTK
ncbi:MAG TPA: NAD(P) transhydrogenase subunit alpha [Streptosporangiaceae bacterium]